MYVGWDVAGPGGGRVNITDGKKMDNAIACIAGRFYGIELALRQRIFQVDTGQLAPSRLILQRMSVIEVSGAGEVDVVEQHRQRIDILMVITLESLLPVISGRDRCHHLQRGKLFWFGPDQVVVLIG